MKNSLIVLLAVVLCLGVLASCDTVQESKPAESAASGEESDTMLVPHLGEADLGGFTLTFITTKYEEERLYGYSQFDINEMTNEPVNDAFFERNNAIEEEYNCHIEVIPSDIDHKMMAYVEPILLAETGSFNVIAAPLIYSAEFSVKGYYHDFLSLEDSVLRLDADYWDKNLASEVSIDGKLDFITGELTVADNEGTGCIFFNKTLISQNGLESPFDLVRENKWTLDTVAQMIKSAAKEDGDGAMGVLGMISGE